MSTHGYVEYRPTGKAKSIITAARNVLIQYQAWDNPMTVRQVFYRLVAEYGYGKTEKAYGSLINYIARSRRAYERYKLDLIYNGVGGREATEQALEQPLLIPFGWIRDEKGQSYQEESYDDADDFLKNVREQAESMKLDRMVGQPHSIELWCEAAGMVPLMAEIAEPYGIRVSSGGGYDSVTAKHRLAQRVLGQAIDFDRPTLVLHIGDFDPSGEGMYETLRDDVGAMVWDLCPDRFEIKRIALTERQVIDWQVETAPPKQLDSRRKAFIAKHPEIRELLGSNDITAQLEALTPPDLRKLLEEAINDVIDRDAYSEALKRETKVRKELMERFN